jgi:hypothetical protein
LRTASTPTSSKATRYIFLRIYDEECAEECGLTSVHVCACGLFALGCGDVRGIPPGGGSARVVLGSGRRVGPRVGPGDARVPCAAEPPERRHGPRLCRQRKRRRLGRPRQSGQPVEPPHPRPHPHHPRLRGA